MVTANDVDRPAHRSHLFILRLWPEDLGGGQTDWRGSIRHVSSGEVRYFRGWPAMEAFVEGLLCTIDAQGIHAAEGENAAGPSLGV